MARAVGVSRRAETGPGILIHALTVLVLLGAALSVATFSRNPLNPWTLGVDPSPQSRLELYGSRGRLERLERGVQVFYLDLGSLPDTLTRLTEFGYVEERDVRDPWGRPYGYEKIAGGYRLTGLDGEGNETPELTRIHHLSSAQRLVLEGTATHSSTGLGPKP